MIWINLLQTYNRKFIRRLSLLHYIKRTTHSSCWIRIPLDVGWLYVHTWKGHYSVESEKGRYLLYDKHPGQYTVKNESLATYANLWLYVVIIEHIQVTTDADCYIIWCSRWFCTPPPLFEVVYCFICGRRRMAVARYRMRCLVLVPDIIRS